MLEKRQPAQQTVLRKQDIHSRRLKLAKTKWIKDLNVRSEPLKTLHENMGKTLEDNLF
jgi:hypothetical protein